MNLRTIRFAVTFFGGVVCALGALVIRAEYTHRYETSVHAPESRNKLPRVFLWAWERPEDLRFVDAEDGVGVAFLAETIEIGAEGSGKGDLDVVMRPRRQPLRVGEATPLMAVVRIETVNDAWHRPRLLGTKAEASDGMKPASRSDQAADAGEAFVYSAAQRAAVVEMIAAAAKLPRVRAVQIDFDAAKSEQPFYAALLGDVRQILPHEMPLSITALASWCIGDAWLNRLPQGMIDEAVPMLFRMGPDARNVAAYVESGNEFKVGVCRASLGLSTDEEFSQQLLEGAIRPRFADVKSKRIYVFSPNAWTEWDFRSATKEAHR